MPDFIERFLGKIEPLEGPRVVLISERKTTSPIYKGLAKAYKGKMVFGEIRTSLVKGKIAEEIMDRY